MVYATGADFTDDGPGPSVLETLEVGPGPGPVAGRRPWTRRGEPADARVGHRCDWAESSDAMRRYHDEEWGVPSHDDTHLFEMLVLEGAQAGLSWSTILNKRENYRRAFDGFDPARVAATATTKVAELLDDPGIVRNRLKVRGAVSNAQAFLATREEHGSFDRYLWAWVDGTTVVNRPRTMADLPARTELSDRLAKDLKRRGFTFVGSTIVYSFLQSVGRGRRPPGGLPVQAVAPTSGRWSWIARALRGPAGCRGARGPGHPCTPTAGSMRCRCASWSTATGWPSPSTWSSPRPHRCCSGCGTSMPTPGPCCSATTGTPSTGPGCGGCGPR